MENEKVELIAAEAYQVIGWLAHYANIFEHDEVQRALDYFSGKTNYDGSMLPFGWFVDKQ